MDFFEHQDRAKRKTSILVFYYFLSILGIVIAIHLAFGFTLLGAKLSDLRPLLNLQAFLIIGATTLTIIGFSTLYKVVQLRRGGGEYVATSLGGTEVSSSTIDLHERKLLNVVEEMSLAAGVPVPKVFVLEGEEGINAFAAGYRVEGAVIGVTRGCIENLTRDQLQGVIAHEFSHILHGDMRLNTSLIGVLFGIMAIAEIGKTFFRIFGKSSKKTSSSSSKKKDGGGGGLVIFVLFLIVIGYIGVLVARIIQAAICRQREFLADAAAVQFTRNPDGIAGALKKIAELKKGSELGSGAVGSASHLFFSSALSSQLIRLFETHPPLPERIQRIEASFDVSTLKEQEEKKESSDTPEGASENVQETLGAAMGFVGGAAGRAKLQVSAQQMVASSGSLNAQHLEQAQKTREAIPDSLRKAAQTPFEARLVVYALLMKKSEDLTVLQTEPQAEQEVVKKFLTHTHNLNAQLKLPLVDLCLPALLQLSLAQYEVFEKKVRALVEHDQQIEVFEYALQKVLLRQLKVHLQPKTALEVKYKSAIALSVHAAVILSVLAHRQGEHAKTAFERGAQELGLKFEQLKFLQTSEVDWNRFDKALEEAAAGVPLVKRKVLLACAQVVIVDGQVSVEEFELIRAIAETLGCPIPMQFF